MLAREQLDNAIKNLSELGPRRLAILGVLGAGVFLTIVIGSYYLSRPDFVTLYSGLNKRDTTRIIGALSEAGIESDLSADGTKVLVKSGKSSHARALLAERGLPSGSSSGYELFDKLGSVGLTSFMQEVTRKRAIEGELARTIQSIRGINAARVHIVLPDRSSFRRRAQSPSASVVLDLARADSFQAARVVRHLVAAAIPDLQSQKVVVMSTDGRVFAASGEESDGGSTKKLELEREVSKAIHARVNRTLAPYLGIDNFQTSVTAQLNIDRRTLKKTEYDPKSRIERSIRVEKEKKNSQNADKAQAVTVQENLPKADQQAAGGKNSRKSTERKVQTKNFEISSIITAVESKGYSIERINVALVVNKEKLGGGKISSQELQKRLNKIQEIAATAAGVDTKRGDRISLVAVKFDGKGQRLTPVPEPGILAIVAGQIGSSVRALTFLLAAMALILFVLRPAVQFLMSGSRQPADQRPEQLSDAASQNAVAAEGQAVLENASQSAPPEPGSELFNEPIASALPSPNEEPMPVPETLNVADQLRKHIAADEERAAQVLMDWLQEARA